MDESSAILEIISVLMDGASAFDSLYNYWISASFAVIVSTHIGRDQFNFSITTAISALYFLASAMFLARFYSHATMMFHLMELAGEEMPADFLDSIPLVGLTRGIMFCLGFLITEYYLWHSYLRTKKTGEGGELTME